MFPSVLPAVSCQFWIWHCGGKLTYDKEEAGPMLIDRIFSQWESAVYSGIKRDNPKDIYL